MKKALVISTGLLILALYPGCAAIENNRRPLKNPLNAQVSQAQKGHKTQWGSNAKGTLYGENMGDFIILQWRLNDSATEYFVYRSTSPNGPWKQTGRFSQGAARTGGAKVHETPDARLMDLCFKVEAIDATGRAIELYEPICVPKFVPSRAQKDDKTQWASNAQGTLYGENMEDSIVLDWELDDRAAQYFVYRATSLNGPWNQVLRTSQAAATTSGARVDLTPDARLMDLCYKVELIHAKGLAIETYEPICVPKFVP